MIDLDISGSHALVVLNRPPLNAINDEWLATFHGVVDRLESASGLCVVHIRSNQKVFCAGMDLRHVQSLTRTAEGVQGMAASVSEFQRLFTRIEQLPVVVMAEIGGAALGGGLELALACDIRIASTRAKIGLPETRLGLIPGAGGTQRLTRLCNRGVASRVILSAEILTGTLAFELGILQWLFEPDVLRQRTEEIAMQIAQLSPSAIREAKALIAAAGDPSRDGFAEELAADLRLFSSSDTHARIDRFLAGTT